ncbi:MAG: type IV pilus twitching motility protein PilT [Candidatus Sumerlaeia bacterium]
MATTNSQPAPSKRPAGTEECPYTMTQLLHLMVESEASDLHIATGRPPVLRVHGNITDVDGPRLSPAWTQKLIYSILSDVQKRDFEENWELDFSLGIAKLSRFRVNVHMQRGTVAAAFRAIPTNIKSFEELRLPRQVLERMCQRPTGFVLVTGPTGSGKSTTLAAMIDHINASVDKHIITVEDPIEFLHQHKRCLVEQREVAQDTRSFSDALKYALRQDPDILLIGEMRDVETISAALTAAETGHLVFSTLHTPDVVQTCDRVIDVFPPHQQEQIRVQLAGVLEGVLCQKLLPSVYGGREIALEILIANDAVRNQIREKLTPQLYTTMQANLRNGMITMDRSLLDLFNAGRITRDDALKAAKKPDEIKGHMNH